MTRLAVAIALCVFSASGASAQGHPLHVQFTPAAVKGALYTPDAGPAPLSG